jgi:hypothetical protein
MKIKSAVLIFGVLTLLVLAQSQAQAKNGGQVRILKDGNSVAVIELPDLPQTGKREIKMWADKKVFDKNKSIWTLKGNVVLRVYNGTRQIMKITADEAKLEPTASDPK